MAAELPDDPTPRQVDAWIELAELVEDDDFRALVRRMAEANSESFRERSREPQAYLAFAKKIALLVAGPRSGASRPRAPRRTRC